MKVGRTEKFHNLVQFGNPSRYVSSLCTGILFEGYRAQAGYVEPSGVPYQNLLLQKIGWISQRLFLKETGPHKGYWDRNRGKGNVAVSKLYCEVDIRLWVNFRYKNIKNGNGYWKR